MKKPFYRWSKLILQDPTVSNSGLYTCNVVSPEGVIIKSRDVRIRVEGKKSQHGVVFLFFMLVGHCWWPKVKDSDTILISQFR